MVRRHRSPRTQLRELEVGRLKESRPSSPTPVGPATADAPSRAEGVSRPPSLVLRSSVGDDNQRTGAAGDRTSRPTFAGVTVMASHAREEQREGVIISDHPEYRSPQAAETIGR